ncbi:hypothetical protein NPIL_670891 [Nephila pilipes]|uniref:Uncharacterized protein n=1 Tax=Nephila pilipes TaxID=299642 RepID=A0A8X6UHA9_NEPPI|nr:hypothetical protein NPIL_670891 [Nephila pilipes]
MEGINNSEHKSKFQYSSESPPLRSELSTSSSHWQEKSRDRKRKKLSSSPDCEWGKSYKNKDSSERIKKQMNDRKVEVIDEPNEDEPSDITGCSQQITAALHQQIAATVPQTQPIMHQPPIFTGPYPPYGYKAPENYMDHSKVIMQ